MNNRLDVIDRTDLAPSEAALQREVALERILHRIGIHGLAVVEPHPRPQMDHQGTVVRPLIAGGELRHDVQLPVDIEQLVAQPREHDARDIAGGQRRIQDVQILSQRDAQRLRESRHHHRKETGGGQQNSAHVEAPRSCLSLAVWTATSLEAAALIAARSNAS
jgi:hypothetical protein